MGRRTENASERITLQIEKKAESAEALIVYIYLIMNAQLNIQNGVFVSTLYIGLQMFMKEPHTAFFVAPAGLRKMQLALNLRESEYFNHFDFDFIIIICPMSKIMKHTKIEVGVGMILKSFQ